MQRCVAVSESYSVEKGSWPLDSCLFTVYVWVTACVCTYVCVIITVWSFHHMFVCTFLLTSVSSVEYVFCECVHLCVRMSECVCGNNYTRFDSFVCVHMSHCNPPPGESRKGLWVICEPLFDWWANQSGTKDFINNRHSATNQQSSTHTLTLLSTLISIHTHTHSLQTHLQSLTDTWECVSLPHPLCWVCVCLWHQ